MAVSTYNAIGSVTLSSAQASFTFSNIPQIYTDLVLVISNLKTATGGYAVRCNINGDAAANYALQDMTGSGTTAYSTFTTSDTGGKIAGYQIGTDTTTPQTIITEFANYSNNTTYKSFISRYSGWVPASGEVDLVSLRWASTAAITSLTLTTGGINMSIGTTFNLYGIGANTLKASGGDYIISNGTYWYHIFTKTGAFIPNQNLTCSVIAIGGGGAGGLSTGGGGGGGEVETYSTVSTTANTSYTATIGAGGAVSYASQSYQWSGSQTTFSTITALGGGGGGNEQVVLSGATGGSGGGGGWQGSGGSASGANTFAGGNGYNASGQSAGGGGGGATAAGGNATNTVGGAGGAGYLVSSLDSGLSSVGPFSTMTRVSSGGGGGSSSTRLPGAGGSGAGSGTNNVYNGGNATSFGSGGGGGGWVGGVGAGGGGSGYQGVVVVRYAV